MVPEFMASDTCFCRAAALASALLKTNETILDEFKVQLKGYVSIWLEGSTPSGDAYHTAAVFVYGDKIYVAEGLFDEVAGFISIDDWSRNIRGGSSTDSAKVYRFVNIKKDPAVKADKRKQYSMSLDQFKHHVSGRPSVADEFYKSSDKFKILVAESLANIKILFDETNKQIGFDYTVVTDKKRLVGALTDLINNPQLLANWKTVLQGYNSALDLHMVRLERYVRCLET